MQVVSLPTPKEKAAQGVVELLEEWLAKARAGELSAIVMIGEVETGYQYARTGVGFEKAIGLHSRAIHNLHRDWDRS